MEKVSKYKPKAISQQINGSAQGKLKDTKFLVLGTEIANHSKIVNIGIKKASQKRTKYLNLQATW